MSCLRIVAADSGAAILNEHFKPLTVVAAATVLVEPPYQKATLCSAEPIFADVNRGYLLIVNELELCRRLLKTVKADVVHLDVTLGGLSVEELSVAGLQRMRVSSRARKQVLTILPQIRKLASDIKRVHDIEVLAIGKESIPVRIAELTTGAYAILYSAEKAVKDKQKIRLGLPAKCQANFAEDGVVLQSLVAAEEDIAACVGDEQKILKDVQISEMPNPCARGFRAIEIVPET